MPEKYVKRTIFWENLTPLDSSHLEVFLRIFWEFFIFLNSNLNFEFGPVWYRPKPEPEPDRFPPVRWTLAPSRRQLVIVLRRPWAFKPVRGKRRNLSLSSSFRRSTTSHPVAASTYACDSGGLTVVAPAATRCHLKLPMVQTKSTTNYLY